MNPGDLHPDSHTAEEVVRLLDLRPLEPEGGFFRRSAEERVFASGCDRRAYSVIYYLVTPSGFSEMHKLDADEAWCFHAGDVLESLRLEPGGGGRIVKLGLNFAAGEAPQDVVPAGVWQGTRLSEGGRWALVSCVVAPEFRWSGFTLGDRAELTARYPDFAQEIGRLTR